VNPDRDLLALRRPSFQELRRARGLGVALAVGGLRGAGFAVAAVVAITSFWADPAPGLHGRSLGVTLSLVLFVGGMVAALAMPRRRGRVLVALGVSLAGAAALMALQTDGLAWLGVFAAVGGAVMWLPSRYALLLWALVLAGLGGAMAASGASATSIVLTELGCAVFVGLSAFVILLREAHRQQADLIEELEATRDARAHAAAIEERGRLAREMHDVLAHSLSALVVQLEGARLLADRTKADPELLDAVTRAHGLAQGGLVDARRAIGALRGDDLPGPERLPALLEDFGEATGVETVLDVAGPPRELPSEARLALFRTAQEALTNVRRHAHPQRVELRVRYEPEATVLRIEDFGEPPAANGDGGGYGLTGMQERAELLGGRLQAGPTREGFRVELRLPA
jgi:signal transduction histidine kinase